METTIPPVAKGLQPLRIHSKMQANPKLGRECFNTMGLMLSDILNFEDLMKEHKCLCPDVQAETPSCH